ncbi:MAG: type II secretion system protein M [Deltaproteobacteria bacterium]|nr:type II secretion system protein M [Deltaproteobacteria bacterium]
MASLTDTVRDRWDGISEREKRLVLLLGGAVIITVVVLLVSSIRDGLTAIDERNNKMRKALVVLSNLRAAGPQKTVDDPTKNIGTTAVSLPTYLAHAAESQKLQVPSFNPRTPVTKDGFITNSGTIELRDLSIQQVKDYLEAIETGNRLVAVTSLTINRNFRDKEKLDLRMEVATYAKVPEAGSGSGSGSGSAVPDGFGSGSGSAAGGAQ